MYSSIHITRSEIAGQDRGQRLELFVYHDDIIRFSLSPRANRMFDKRPTEVSRFESERFVNECFVLHYSNVEKMESSVVKIV